ncbi:MAG: hypothetical protein OEX00_10025 [Gammaproteobacteria bacterium]|nr:hypothetical protein [Gammaproteobacteria bacterium]MDH5694517.1 hypothetical protein [Gammaproteobacteria bacterium]
MINAKSALFALTTLLLAGTTNAAPVTLSSAQMDTVSGGAFVCPVISTDAVLNAKNGIEINGAYSILGPDVSVPVHATNGDGTGSPGSTFASPGDTNYTAIWN